MPHRNVLITFNHFYQPTNALNYTNLEDKISVVWKFKRHKIKNHSNMFRILRDPSSGSTELCLTEIARSGSQVYFVCLVGVWQCNFEL